MVATRHSLPTTSRPSSAAAAPPAGEKKVQNALKKLQIDGTAALYGEAPAREEDQRTYHWRGAAYAVTDGTAEEWIERQPKRYLRRSEGGEGEGCDGVEGEVEEGVGKRARVEDDGDGEQEEDVPSKKQRTRRRSVPEKFYGRPKRLSSARTSRKRKRSSQVEVEGEDEQQQDEIPTSRLYDPAVTGGHQEMSCAHLAARARAEKRGYQLEAIPQQALREGGWLVRTVVQNVARVVKMNERIEEVRGEYRRAGERLERFREMRARAREGGERDGDGGQAGAGASASARGAEEAGSLSESRDHAPAAEAVQPHSPRVIIFHPDGLPEPPTPPSNTPPSHTSISLPTPPRHDSLSLSPPSPPTTTTPIPPNTSKKRDPPSTTSFQPLPLPATNKAGHPLRWSLASVEDGDLDLGRAEEAIETGRLEGESKAARRRRVKRERGVVRGWGVRSLVEGVGEASLGDGV